MVICEVIALRSKLPQVGTTIFTLMTRMAQAHDAINLSQGFPDFDCPAALRERVSFYLNDRRNQYAPMAGVMELREQIAVKVEDLYGCRVDADQEITVTSGATEALFDAIQATVGTDDEVIMFDPAFDSYDPAVRLAGGVPVHIPMQLPAAGQGWAIDWDRVADKINDRTRLIIINSPHNPSGSVLTRQDLDTLAGLIRDRDILVLSDEVYEHMVFDGGRHESVLCHTELKEKSFAVFSFGKTYHATGWKAACCVAPPALSAEFRKVHQFVTFTSTSFIQHAIADFMRDCPEHHLQLPDFYQQKRDFFCHLIADSRFTFTPSAGTYFQCVDYSAISALPDMEFVSWLCRDQGVAAIPLSPFCAEAPDTKIIRFCFCKDDTTLEAAAQVLRSL
jgi:methionine aminotransferase